VVYICIVLAAGLAYCTYVSKDKTVRLILAAFCAINLAAAAHAAYKHDPYAFRLKPNDHSIEDNYRRP
jgi:hypothetical protein